MKNKLNKYTGNIARWASIRYGVLLFLLLALSMAIQAQKKQLVILHTNDTHSTIYPLKETLLDTIKAGRGGFLRRIALIQQERQQHPDLLLFDSGDFSQGSPYYTMYKGDVEVELMNRMHYDAVTIGNHEFDFGLENMARLFRQFNAPVVCSNYDFTGTPVEGTVKPYIILKRNGLRIGVFAVCAQLKGLVAGDCYGDTKYLEPIEVAQQMVDILQKKNCDLIICLSHLGWDVDTGATNDNQLIANTRGIDLVLGGHSHSYLDHLEYVKNLDGKPIPVDQNGKHAIFVGRMVLDFSK